MCLEALLRELDAINRKHFAANHATLVTHREYRRKHRGDIVAERTDEMGNDLEVRRVRAAERDNVTCSSQAPGNGATAHQSPRVPEQHHFEQKRGRIRRCARRVIPEPRVERRLINGMINEVIERVFKRAGQQLTGEVHRQELRIGIDRFVAVHDELSTAW